MITTSISADGEYVVVCCSDGDRIYLFDKDSSTPLWTYVAGDKTFCIYLADTEALIHEHAERSGFPATTVTEVRKMIDPVTAEPD